MYKAGYIKRVVKTFILWFTMLLIGITIKGQEISDSVQNRSEVSIRIMAITVLVYNHGSLSFNYNITKKHSVGFNFSANAFYNPLQYIPSNRVKNGIGTYYRFYFAKEGKAKYFAQSMIGYYILSIGNSNGENKSHNLYAGPAIGITQQLRNAP